MTDQSELDNPLGSDSSSLECEICGKVCKSELGLRSHLRSHEPKVTPTKAAKPSNPELKQVQKELAENIKTVGQVLHPVLLNAKILKLQNPDLVLRVPGTGIEAPFPNFDTHLAYTLISRSELTAKVLTDYAASNATLLTWLVRFNSWFKGGETGSLIGAHIVAAAGTVGISNGVISAGQAFLIPDVMPLVEEENRALRTQVEEMAAQLATYRSDERGSRN